MANRHDVIIWDADVYGAPDGYTQQTIAKAKALIKQPAEPSKKLLAFARDIEQYSKLNDTPAAIARHLAHFEANVKAEHTAAYCFNLPDYNWHSLVEILLKEAKKHGLALFDEEVVLVLLPNGSITPKNSESYWLQVLDAPKRKNAFPETLIEFYKLLKTRAGALLAEHDFVLDTDNLVEEGDEFYINYMRQISSGNHQICFDCKGGDSQFKLVSYFQLVENTMIEIGMKSDFQYSMDGGGGVLLKIANIFNPQNSKFMINNWESFEELLFTLKQSALKWSDAAQDIAGMDALFNGDIDDDVRDSVHSRIYMPYCLIAARLAGNPNFEDLAVSLGRYDKDSDTFWGKFNNTIISTGWPKLVKYLREEVKPLV